MNSAEVSTNALWLLAPQANELKIKNGRFRTKGMTCFEIEYKHYDRNAKFQSNLAVSVDFRKFEIPLYFDLHSDN